VKERKCSAGNKKKMTGNVTKKAFKDEKKKEGVDRDGSERKVKIVKRQKKNVERDVKYVRE